MLVGLGLKYEICGEGEYLMAEHPIVFLHLSDIHICNEKDISDKHINKIVDSLRSYKTDFNTIIIIISGDITQSGELIQFKNAGKLMGSLITKPLLVVTMKL